jgi:alginate O-acetyltransferase complex protein AlgI
VSGNPGCLNSLGGCLAIANGETVGVWQLNAYLRVFCGMVKVVLISSAFQTWHEQLVSQIGEGGLALRLGRFVLVLNTYMMFLYFNFSGYCDAVIAGAALVGLPLPENFNYPFLSRNLLDYWSRWHITLGHWIRDYLFTPFYKAGVERFPNRTMTVAVVSYFFAFSLAGVWHGSTWNFLIYGLLHGAGVSAAKLWEHAIIKRSGRPGLRRYLARPGIRWLAIFLTYNYASFTLFFFAFDLERGIRILNDVLALPVRGY